jgi:pimeloyl-ACP methyl ester carboxylesterase
MNTVQSADGTQITYSTVGDGPPVIVVDGALCYRSFGQAAKLAAALSPRFTVFTYDRRGRGNSGDTAPHTLQREIEDLQALIAVSSSPPSFSGTRSR